ncbi:Serine hydrolase [Wickerhamomyces ciferrii]|uniref:Serine hydrolase n=1 Tax=Wickerhamomyces ciferrii (strain ATCC 14091 / BCRC 22168 / CBS 111 / JCM 3599 / NBRC 0793 / NRRL Y-1031 F-60-10) TaxID=1206466 RepID=K0KL07_WICCF|nr:Serine hydrolase [Wickerhamomyces ciferrii]CCH45915.1 Serine hydrolase [Wickerhamomyces ciferrii]
MSTISSGNTLVTKNIKMSIPYQIKDGKQPRIIELTTAESSYSGEVWPIDNDQKYKGRVLLLPNPGEDVKLYHKLIDLLGSTGYETLFVPTKEVYKTDTDIYREINRILELCISDLDSQSYVTTHKLHIIGQFIIASRVIAYGVKGHYKHRIKSVIAINPFLSPKKSFDNLTSQTTTSILSKISSTNTSKFPLKYEHLTSDKHWLDYLKEHDYNFSKIRSNYLKEILHISHVLQLPKKYADFSIKNVLLIQSEQDPVSKLIGLQNFYNNCPSENINILVYPEGKNNLIIETDDIFKQLSCDIISWLAHN